VNRMSMPICSVCRTRPATHVCRTCGGTVCSNCISLATWTCSACNANLSKDFVEPSGAPQFSFLGLLLALASAAIFIGMLLLVFGSISSLTQGSSGGAVILIGPIPIILGNSSNSLMLVAIGAVLTVITLAFFLVLRRKLEG